MFLYSDWLFYPWHDAKRMIKSLHAIQDAVDLDQQSHVILNACTVTRRHILLRFTFRYNLLFYINPVFYGFSAIMKVLLQDVQLTCKNDSILNCISTDGNAVLTRFGFHTVNVYENLLVGLCKSLTVIALVWKQYTK